MVKQPLQIRLTEPVIFLRGPSTGLDFRGRPQLVRDDAPPAMLRGLLTLRLSKPTRIRKIEIKLEGKARTEWPEGIGPRRLETYEEHMIIDDRTTYYTYKDQFEPRRAESVGPGLSLDYSAYDEDDVDTLSPQEEAEFDWGQIHGRGRDRAPRSASAMAENGLQGITTRGSISERSSVDSPLEGFENLSTLDPGPSPAYTPELVRSGENSRASSIRGGASNRNVRAEPILSPIMSAAPSRAASDRTESTSTERRLERQRPDGVHLPGVTESEEIRPILEVRSRGPSGSGVRFNEAVRGDRNCLPQTPEDEHAPQLSPSSRRQRTSSILTTDSMMSDITTSSSTNETADASAAAYHPTSSAIQAISAHVTPSQTPAPSAPPSIRGSDSSEDLRETANRNIVSPPTSRPSTRPTSTTNSAASSRSDLREVRAGRTSRNGSMTTIIINHDPTPVTSSTHNSSSNIHGPTPANPSPLQRPPVNHRNSSDDRGRKDMKFSLSAALRGLSQDVKDRVRNKSRSRPGSSGPSRRTSFSDQNGGGARTGSARPSRSDSKADFHPPHGRGGAGRAPSRERSSDRGDSLGRGRNKGMKALTGALHMGEEEEGEHIHHWKEFKKGTYNYPISFPIPVDAPPTIHAEFGNVSYRLKATVVRVGALTPNLVDEMEVFMIASPQEDDLEESENVIVERQWEEQMRYQITLHGKAFPIGGTIIRLMPLLKCKIHRVSVTLEEKTDYFAQERKVARHEQPKKYTLLFIKQPERKERIEPLLPIISDDVNAARESPLAELAREAAMNDPERAMEMELYIDGNDDDRMYAGLMDPLGPWHLEKSIQIPDCNARVRFSTKHEKTNISVGHSLKVILRVERGDDEALDAKGRRKQFDIIIETPIKILDCRVNPQWNSLPTYSAYNSSAFAAQTVCTLHNKAKNPPLHLDTGSRNPQASTSTNNTATPDARIASSSDPNGSSSRGPATRGRATTPHGVEPGEDTLLERNIVYDRLMSGQETETGEVPPTYGEAVAQAIRSASHSRSASRSRPRISRAGTLEGLDSGELISRTGSGSGFSRVAGIRDESRSLSRVRDRDGDGRSQSKTRVSKGKGKDKDRAECENDRDRERSVSTTRNRNDDREPSSSRGRTGSGLMGFGGRSSSRPR